MSTQQMHAAVLHGIGQTPRYERFPAPVAGDDEAVVTVTAAALKPSDRRGMAEQTLVRRRLWLPVSDGVDDVTAAAVLVDRPREELAAALAAAGPYDLIVDYLWGAPAEAVFAALTHRDGRGGGGPRRIRYVLVGMSAGAVAGLPAMTLRGAPGELAGSGIGGRAGLADAAAAYAGLLRQVAAGEVTLDIDPVPLAKVEQAWPHAGSDRRTVFIPMSHPVRPRGGPPWRPAGSLAAISWRAKGGHWTARQRGTDEVTRR